MSLVKSKAHPATNHDDDTEIRTMAATKKTTKKKTSNTGKATAANSKSVKDAVSSGKGKGTGQGDQVERFEADDGMITETFIDADGEETTVVRRAPKKATRGAGRTKGTKVKAATASTEPTGPTAGALMNAESGAQVDAGDVLGAPVGATRAKGKKDQTSATKTTATKTTATTPTATKHTANITLADLGERFLKHLEALGKSRATVFSYSIDLGLMCRELGGETDAGAFTEDQVGEFFRSDAVMKTRTGKAKSQLTIDKTRRVARQVLEFAVAEQIIQTSPVPESAMPTRKRKESVAKNEVSDATDAEGGEGAKGAKGAATDKAE